MHRLKFSDIFSNDYLAVITKYRLLISEILKEYDVVIFMARKAICFYNAMKANGEITEEYGCHIISSRAVDYGSLKRFGGKRIAVIDDVVVKGDSIRAVAKKLKEEKIDADFYVAACEKNFADCSMESSINLQKMYVHYLENDIYKLAVLITRYIEASMCPMNIDSPVYENSQDMQYVKALLDSSGAPNLSSEIQRKRGIENRVMYFTLMKEDPIKDYYEILKSAIIKIRFYINEQKILAIPFILLPCENLASLDKMYKLVKTPLIDELIACDNKNLNNENKLKIISYLLSAGLMDAFAKKYDITFMKNQRNDNIQLDNIIENIIPEEKRIELCSIFDRVKIYKTYFSPFKFSDCLKKGYDYISHVDVETQLYRNSDGDLLGMIQGQDRLNRLVFSYEDLYQYVGDFDADLNEKTVYVSSIIDVFIDMGFIVPYIACYKDDGYIRAYKMGEYSKLTRDQIKAFAMMLFQYQTILDRELDKTEFEKLCVLFFRSEMSMRHFEEQTSFEEGVYSIGYSLYGPRVSTGEVAYSVQSNSTILTDFIDDQIVKEQNNKYYVVYKIEPRDEVLRMACINFATGFAQFAKFYAYHLAKADGKVYNQYVHTYNQYLTLLAINNTYKNQILSLCAELFQILQIKDKMFSDGEMKEDELLKYKRALSGINSGLWKYRCYKNDALEKTTIQLMESEANPPLMCVLYSMVMSGDKNEKYNEILDQCGKILYQTAFFINEVLKSQNKIEKYRFDSLWHKEEDFDIFGQKNIDLLFSKGDYYFKRFRDLRHKIEQYVEKSKEKKDFLEKVEKGYGVLKAKSRLLLDWCDLYLERNNPEYEIVDKFLVMISREGNIPIDYFRNCNVSFANITEIEKCAVFIVPDIEYIDSVIKARMHDINGKSDVDFIFYDMTGTDFSFIQIENKARVLGILLQEIITEL